MFVLVVAIGCGESGDASGAAAIGGGSVPSPLDVLERREQADSRAAASAPFGVAAHQRCYLSDLAAVRLNFDGAGGFDGRVVRSSGAESLQPGPVAGSITEAVADAEGQITSASLRVDRSGETTISGRALLAIGPDGLDGLESGVVAPAVCARVDVLEDDPMPPPPIEVEPAG